MLHGDRRGRHYYALAAALIAAVTVVAGVLLGLWHGGTATVLGTAHVITASRPPAGNIVGRCDMVLLVDLPGMNPITVSHRDAATPVPRWPRTGMVLPIEAAPRNPRNLRIRWNSVPVQTAAVIPDEDVVGPFFTEFRDQPTPEPPASTPPGAASGWRRAHRGERHGRHRRRPDPADARVHRGERRQRAWPAARPWDDPPPEHPLIDAELLDDEVLDAELIEGRAFADEAFAGEAFGDEAFVDGTFLDEALADELLVDDEVLADLEGLAEPSIPVIPVIPVIPQPRDDLRTSRGRRR